MSKGLSDINFSSTTDNECHQKDLRIHGSLLKPEDFKDKKQTFIK